MGLLLPHLLPLSAPAHPHSLTAEAGGLLAAPFLAPPTSSPSLDSSPEASGTWSHLFTQLPLAWPASLSPSPLPSHLPVAASYKPLPLCCILHSAPGAVFARCKRAHAECFGSFSAPVTENKIGDPPAWPRRPLQSGSCSSVQAYLPGPLQPHFSFRVFVFLSQEASSV